MEQICHPSPSQANEKKQKNTKNLPPNRNKNILQQKQNSLKNQQSISTPPHHNNPDNEQSRKRLTWSVSRSRGAQSTAACWRQDGRRWPAPAVAPPCCSPFAPPPDCPSPRLYAPPPQCQCWSAHAHTHTAPHCTAKWGGDSSVARASAWKASAMLTRVRVPGAARDFCPRVNVQCRLSYRVCAAPMSKCTHHNLCVC